MPRLRGRVPPRHPRSGPDDDPTHGRAALSFSTVITIAGATCRDGVVSFNDRAEQYLVAAVLRPRNVTAAAGAWAFCAD